MGGMKGVKYRAKKERDKKRKEETFYEIKYSRRLTRHQLAWLINSWLSVVDLIPNPYEHRL